MAKHQEHPDRRETSLGRREVLAGLAASGVLPLAGCGNGKTEVDGETDTTAGQPYTFLARINPNAVNWALPPPPLSELLYPPGATIHPSGDIEPQLASSTDVTPDRVTLTIREGVTWTNGEPILAKDLGRWLEMFRVLGPDPADVARGTVVPGDWRFAFTNIEWDGRELVATTPAGLLEQLTTRFDVWTFFNEKVGATPRAYFEDIWNTYTEEHTDPWGDVTRLEAARTYLRTALANPAIENPGLRSPDNVVSSGPWQVDTAHANEISLRPHDGHPTMPDGANWSSLVIKPANQLDKAIFALKANAGDAFQPRIGGTNRSLAPQAHEALPDNIRAWDAKATSGEGLLLNQKHELLADRRVRAALAHIADRANLAAALNRIVERPVDVQGLAGFDETALPEGVRSTLRAYDTDSERAAELLRDAGFTDQGGTWQTPGGAAFELPVFKQLPQLRVTRPPSPLLANTFVKQLEAFGIETELVGLEPAVAQKRFEQGNFHVVMHPWPVIHRNGHPYHRAAWWYASAVGFGVNRRRQLHLFEEDLPQLVADHDELRWQRPDHPETSGIVVRDPTPLQALTVEAPPVGEPDGSLQAYPVVAQAVRAMTNWSWDEAKRQEALEELVWVFNYDVPHIELTRTVPQLYHDTAEWDVPPPDDPAWRHNGPGGYPSGIVSALQRGVIAANPTDTP